VADAVKFGPKILRSSAVSPLSPFLFLTLTTMSTSKFLSLPRRIASRFRRPRTVHVCGLLGTYSIEDTPSADDDYWMATDFVALRQLIGASDESSLWLCGTPIRRQRGFLLGDPTCDRIVFDPGPFETVREIEPNHLASEFLIAVTKVSDRLSAGETLVVVLVGHGNDQNHSFIVGEGDGSHPQDYRLYKEVLEACVRDTKGEILVISTHWTLLAATGPDQHSPSIVASGSGKYRGGFFTNALLAEYASELNIRPPYPRSMDQRGSSDGQKDDPEKMICPLPPKQSIQEVIDWIHQFRDDIGRTYTSTSITCFTRRPHDHRLPFASLMSATAPFHHLVCVPPSPASNHAPIRSASTYYPAVSSPQNVAPRKLSAEEELELIHLADDLLNYMPLPIASERSIIIRCWRIIYGPARGAEPLSDAHRSELYSALKNRICKRKLVLAIANNLGWSKAVQEVGVPEGEQMQKDDMVALRREAEASGCLVSILVIRVTSFTGWGGAAGWLARVWEAIGRPIVSPDEWAIAVKDGLAMLEG
jgi:hypothetical protein